MNFKIIEITDKQFARLGEVLTTKVGIKLPPEKRIMFQSRLQSRLTALGFDSFDEYSSYFFDPQNQKKELPEMIDLISTNKTEFFRENEHFNLLKNNILPLILGTSKTSNEQFLKCWSAGSSSGQEAFSLSMVFEEFRESNPQLGDYFILGTDISNRMLSQARKGIYPFAASQQIPDEYLKKYVLKSKDLNNPRIKMVKNLRSKIDFKYANLMDVSFNFHHKFQLVFIRNTLIYFDQVNQYEVLKKVIDRLLPGGYLFIGHSESLINMDLPIRIVWPSVYQKLR